MELDVEPAVGHFVVHAMFRRQVLDGHRGVASVDLHQLQRRYLQPRRGFPVGFELRSLRSGEVFDDTRCTHLGLLPTLPGGLQLYALRRRCIVVLRELPHRDLLSCGFPLLHLLRGRPFRPVYGYGSLLELRGRAVRDSIGGYGLVRVHDVLRRKLLCGRRCTLHRMRGG